MKVLDRKLLRDLWLSKGQAAAVTMVIVCGVASFVCVLSAYRSLGLTQQTYYEDYRFADFWVPLERAPSRVVAKVAALPGVQRAQGRIVEDVNLDVPGNPEPCGPTVDVLRRAMALGRPILGICLGCQLMALAAGARTYKLRYGHRGQNQPCREEGTDRCSNVLKETGHAEDAAVISHAEAIADQH